METVMDYYPFGAEHHNPEISTQPKPRYRYSGKEEQLEAMNGILDFGSRYYNPQIGRWLHPDPQAESYYQYSPYTYCANNPTNLIDPDGERIVVTDYFSSKTESDNFYEWTNETGKWQFVDFFTRKPYIKGTDAYFDALTQAFERMMSNSYDKSRIEELVALNEIVVIDYNIHGNNKNKYLYNGTTIFKEGKPLITYKGGINWYSPKELVKNNIERSVVLEGKIHTEYTIVDATYALLHELTHFYDHVTNPKYVEEKWRRTSTSKKLTKSEIHALHVENMSRASHGDRLRSQYTVPGDGIIRTTGKNLFLFPNSYKSRYYFGPEIHETNFEVINKKKQTPYEYK